MEAVNSVELHDESRYPDEAVLRQVLGESYQAYTSLLELFDNNKLEYEWRYYQDGKTWLCKVQSKKRTIVWMSAWKDYMRVTIYFPEKYIEHIYKLDIAEELRKRIQETQNVGKSKPCIFDIRDTGILKDFNKVMQLKMALK
jgi:hypothetical protein